MKIPDSIKNILDFDPKEQLNVSKDIKDSIDKLNTTFDSFFKTKDEQQISILSNIKEDIKLNNLSTEGLLSNIQTKIGITNELLGNLLDINDQQLTSSFNYNAEQKEDQKLYESKQTNVLLSELLASISKIGFGGAKGGIAPIKEEKEGFFDKLIDGVLTGLGITGGAMLGGAGIASLVTGVASSIGTALATGGVATLATLAIGDATKAFFTGKSFSNDLARSIGLVKSKEDIANGTDSRSNYNPLKWLGMGFDKSIELAANTSVALENLNSRINNALQREVPKEEKTKVYHPMPPRPEPKTNIVDKLEEDKDELKKQLTAKKVDKKPKKADKIKPKTKPTPQKTKNEVKPVNTNIDTKKDKKFEDLSILDKLKNMLINSDSYEKNMGNTISSLANMITGKNDINQEFFGAGVINDFVGGFDSLLQDALGVAAKTTINSRDFIPATNNVNSKKEKRKQSLKEVDTKKEAVKTAALKLAAQENNQQETLAPLVQNILNNNNQMLTENNSNNQGINTYSPYDLSCARVFLDPNYNIG